MKYLWGCLLIMALVGAFVLGALMHNYRAFAQSKQKLAVCTANTCLRSRLSVFSKDLLLKSQTPKVVVPSGFCLQVPVLLYHHIEPQADAALKGQTSLNVDAGIFDQQMAYLASHGYNTISADQLVNAIVSHAQLPAKSIVLTFDDGYLDNYLYAFPVLQKYHLVGNLMVPTGLLGANSGTNSYYTWDQLGQMVSSGLLFAYDHTWSHFAMGTGPAAKDTYELLTGQEQLKQHLGNASPIFVYPYGSGQTVPWVQKLIHDNGFVAAFSTLPGRYQCESNLLALPRLHIGNAPLSGYGI